MSASNESLEGPRASDCVQSLARGPLGIRAFDAEHPELGFSCLSELSVPDSDRDAVLRQSELTALTDHTLTSTADLLRDL